MVGVQMYMQGDNVWHCLSQTSDILVTKTKTTMILITKTLVIFSLFTLQHDDFDKQNRQIF